MKAEELKELGALLESRKQALLDEADRAVGGMIVASGAVPDPGDRALLESNRNAMLRMRDRERKLISKIDEAMMRIADGSYGSCESCGGEIGMARLRARPVTTLCIDCKSAEEANEQRRRRTGHT